MRGARSRRGGLGWSMDGLITIVGGTGFVGRYVVQELARRGARIRVVSRDPQKALFLKPLGGVGQIQLVAGDVTDAASLAAACKGAAAVVNLVGILAEDAEQTFDAVQAQGAANVAQAAARAGATALVHISAIGADPEAETGYARTKGEGEAAVRQAFPSATILRPSIIFGPEDQFINRFARLLRLLPFAVPVVAGRAALQPVYVLDVARAIVAAIEAPERFGGQAFELGGPRVWTLRELIAWIEGQIYAHKALIDVPDSLAAPLAFWFGWLPGAPITYDQWRMLQRGNVARGSLPGLEAFGIAPTPIEAIAPTYLVRYRKHGRFNRGEQDNKAY